MTQLRSLLIGSSFAAFATTAAVAQTSMPAPAMQPGQAAQHMAPPTAPAAQGVQMPAPAPQAQSQQTLAPPDPLVQKRNADAGYPDAKKAPKGQSTSK
jgi:hypothetical protein